MRFISNCNNNGIASKKLQNEIDELTNQLGNTQADLEKEATSRRGADGVLGDKIDTEVTARQNADNSLRSSIETDKQDLADYKTAIANSVSTKTVNANSVTTENLAASNGATVSGQLGIQKRGSTSNGIVVKTFDEVYLTGNVNNWYLLAQWPSQSLPEIECVFGQGPVSGGFKITPEVIETKGHGDIQIALGRQGNNEILAIKGSGTIVSFVAKYDKYSGFTAFTSSLTTVAEGDIQKTFTIDGHVYLNNFAVPNDLSVRNHVFANNVISEEANFTKEKVTTSNIALLENSKRNIKKDYITLATHQTNTRYYIRLPKFNGTYTCTLVKDDRQLFSLEVLEHGDYVELNYSSIDANDATVDSYLEEFWLDKYGMLYFKTFGDGKLYYSYNAEGELPAPESYSNLPISGNQIKADYVSHAFTEKVILQGQIGTISIGTTSGANMLIAIWTGTQEEYNAMPVTDPNTLYLIEE